MFWVRRILLAVSALALLLMMSLLAAALTRRHWQREWVLPDKQVELVSKWPVLKPSDVIPNSAFDLLQRAAKAQSGVRPPEIQKELRRLNVDPWSDSSFPILTRLLEENHEALDLARSAAIARDPQMPTYLSITDSFPYVTPVMRISELFRASAARKVAMGDMAGAYAELESSMAFVQILSRGGCLIHVMVEMACEIQASKAMRLIALQNDLPPDVASHAIARLLDISRTAEPLAETYRAEYRAVPSLVDMFFDPSKPSILGIMQDEHSAGAEQRIRSRMKKAGWLVGSTREDVIADLARVYKSLIDVAEKPYQAEEIKRLEKTFLPRMQPRDWILTRDPVGYMLATITLPTFVPIVVRYHGRTADLHATAAVIAVRQFQQNQNGPLQVLQDLVPTYLPQVPIDPFSGAPLQFRVRADNKWIVYSVGPNQLDEGGEQPKVDPRKYDDPGDLAFCECEADVTRSTLSVQPRQNP
jgi:hypothetical protein